MGWNSETNKWESEKQEFPHQYKQYKVLEMMMGTFSQSKLTHAVRYTDVIRLAWNLSNGEGSYDADTTPVVTKQTNWGEYRTGGNPHRGYWSGVFQRKWHHLYGANSTGWMNRLADKGIDGKYRINKEGVTLYWKLDKKYKGVTPDEARAMQKK
jgi:hypothetical protein